MEKSKFPYEEETKRKAAVILPAAKRFFRLFPLPILAAHPFSATGKLCPTDPLQFRSSPLFNGQGKSLKKRAAGLTRQT